jgi:transcriptional regulator with PAS, ATPase and Fis domain
MDDPYQYPLSIKTKMGGTKKVEMTVVPLKDANGKPQGVVGSFKDVTKEFELAKKLGEVEQFSGIIGKSEKMQIVYQTIRDVADSSIPVFVHGESGTGKELVASAIHNESSRSKKLFVPVNCGALPDTLLESELFGHVKGAFTGAIRDKKGRFELADKGTLFLDEIGDISPAMQVKLLRVLQDGIIERLGSEQGIQVDVRVISATNKNLQKEVEEERFREDLYYRLCVAPIYLPPLRERKEDIPLLLTHLLKELATMAGRSDMVVSRQALDILLQYQWHGNVRELINCLQYAIVRCKGLVIEPPCLPAHILEKKGLQKTARFTQKKGKRKKKLTMAKVKQALEQTGNNKTKAAKFLGVGRATLYRFLSESDNDI